ncbi:hypothetical protein COLO4_22982 [Corchorus olitorius]|uniref:Pentatricopeptide repeat-containing protein n=1 Tax=Corchorus olitorius TaxID=93759 RepID=A0A1R3IIS4_9ROSI|nr:hypothetical protein COLO4_22982 [Corchorus olitorius]
MQSLNRIAKSLTRPTINSIHSKLAKPHLNPTTLFRALSTKHPQNDKDESWNDAWETAWLPDDISPKNKAPWEGDVNFPSNNEESTTKMVLSSEVDAETKAFVEDMNENWNERRKSPKQKQREEAEKIRKGEGGGLYSLENMKKDYRLKKQRIHAGLWMKEIDKLEEAKLGDSADDIDKLLDSCSDIFDTPNTDLENSKIPGSSELKNKPDGWETTSKAPDGNVWEMSQREEDILLQEFDRRIAYCKFQIASFIKTHIFSRRRPIDGWKYMIEEIGPNARKGKGSVSRLPSLSDPSTQPFKEEKMQIGSSSQSRFKGSSCKQASEISQIHGYIIKTGLEHDTFILSKLLLASSLQEVNYAASIFKQIQNPNLFMYNTLLRGYSITGDCKEAISIFNNLRAKEGILLDQFSFVTTLKACSRQLATFNGQTIHGVALRSGHLLFINVKNALLYFYGVCGRILDAHKLFDEIPHMNDVVSWNSLMGAYLNVSEPGKVIALFRQMRYSCLTMSIPTLLTVLSAIGEVGDSLIGESIHGHCLKVGFCFESNVASALIDMYAETGNVYLGRKVFNEVVVKDVSLWNCMISKYAETGLLEESLALLRLMKVQQVKPNSTTLVGLLSACSASGAVSLGQCISSYLEEEGLPLDAVIGTALVDMYAKCGLLDKAINVFQRMETKDVKSWTAIISGYGIHGLAPDAVRTLYKMEEEGFVPNEVTFLVVLSACSHGGLVAEGMKCFERMIQEYGISPKIEHYGCIIDLFGRAGLLEEAYNFIKRLPIKSDATAWRTLLSACRIYGNIELGEHLKSVLVGFNHEHPTDSILLSSTYAIAGMLPDQTRMQAMEKSMFKRASSRSAENKEDRMIKEAGYSAIETGNEGLELNW